MCSACVVQWGSPGEPLCSAALKNTSEVEPVVKVSRQLVDHHGNGELKEHGEAKMNEWNILFYFFHWGKLFPAFGRHVSALNNNT